MTPNGVILNWSCYSIIVNIILLILLGLCFGSFINALIWRIHKQESLESKSQKAEYSITRGRSMCMHCKHILEPRDLIPVFSWLLLHGKCRYCHKPIPDTPVSELLTPLLFLFSYAYWPLDFNNEGKVLFGFWLVYLVGFVALALYDFRWYILPNRIVFPLMYVAAFQILVQLIFFGLSIQDMVMILLSIAVGGGIFYLLFQISSGKWIGGGDVKLGFLIGAILANPALSILYIFTAALIGTFVSIPLLVAGKAKRSTHLPFGPFLLAAALIMNLFGTSLVNWYTTMIGI
jgi:prepilin signal peptidase PulO-like enzyme (type II secretory pathway)